MSAALVITDNKDGTGATATITGSTGATNQVYISRVNGQCGSLAFALAATRVGDGNVTFLPPQKGLWFGYVLSGGALTNLYYFSVTDGRDSVATRVRRAVVSTLQLLQYPFAQNVYEQIFPDESNLVFPCAVCTVDGVSETQQGPFSVLDNIGRPVKVMICDRSDRYDHGNLPNYELWRQAADRCFREQQLAGVPESIQCTIEPYTIIDPKLPEYQFAVTAFTVRALCREPRGVGV